MCGFQVVQAGQVFGLLLLVFGGGHAGFHIGRARAEVEAQGGGAERGQNKQGDAGAKAGHGVLLKKVAGDLREGETG